MEARSVALVSLMIELLIELITTYLSSNISDSPFQQMRTWIAKTKTRSTNMEQPSYLPTSTIGVMKLEHARLYPMQLNTPFIREMTTRDAFAQTLVEEILRHSAPKQTRKKVYWDRAL